MWDIRKRRNWSEDEIVTLQRNYRAIMGSVKGPQQLDKRCVDSWWWDLSYLSIFIWHVLLFRYFYSGNDLILYTNFLYCCLDIRISWWLTDTGLTKVLQQVFTFVDAVVVGLGKPFLVTERAWHGLLVCFTLFHASFEKVVFLSCSTCGWRTLF